jgi:uncharacterized membrane-anchored protein YhcB (DUF1043 family)
MHQLVVMIEDLEKINQHLAQTKDSLLHKMNEIHLKMPELVSEEHILKNFQVQRALLPITHRIWNQCLEHLN